jgi:hypothetical protein
MTVRANQEPLFPGDATLPHAEFPVVVCEAKPRKNAATIVADGKPLRPPPAEIRRIVVLGDTGCRIKKKKTQDCDNPAEWPYRALARRAADAKPDLVLHVGIISIRRSPAQNPVAVRD